MASDLQILARRGASDGSAKYLLQLGDGRRIESVYLPVKERRTICVSSQVGCVLDCAFCATGTMAFVRNLDADEIVGQVNAVSKDVAQRTGVELVPTNIVFMGMGEPFHNYENVIRAADVFSDPRGMSIAPRKITLSTAGILPQIERYLAGGKAYKLAISVTSAIEKKRSRLMPVNERYSLPALREIIGRYPSRRILIEVPLMAGVNDQPEDAEALLAFCSGLRVRVNLIPWNPSDIGSGFSAPDREVVLDFQRTLRRDGMNVFIRQSLGRDVQGACGQLVLQR